MTASQDPLPRSWFYDLIKRMRLLPRLVQPMTVALNRLPAPQPPNIRLPEIRNPRVAQGLDWLWLSIVIATALWGGWAVVTFFSRTLTFGDAVHVFGLCALTLARVLILIVIARIIWVPIGVWIGLRPIWAMSGFSRWRSSSRPSRPTVLFPAVVGVIVAVHADPNIWLSPLMILGTQWYILFNVIAGAAAIPNDLKEAASIFHVRSWQWVAHGRPGPASFPTTSPAP